MIRLSVLIFILLICLGCTNAQSLSARFEPKEASFIHRHGKATLSGQAFLRRRDGGVVLAAGSRVYLIPSTAYSRERLGHIFGGRKFNSGAVRFAETDPRYPKMMRVTKADAEGRFAFAALADGEYFLTTALEWEADGRTRGGQLLEKVSIRNGKDARIILTGD